MSSLAETLSRELSEKVQEWISEQVAPAMLIFCQQQGLQQVTLEQIVQHLGASMSTASKAAPAARTSKPLLTPEKAQQLMDPNFDDKFNPQGCFYFTTTRGAQPFTFCGVSGAQVCQSCAKKAEGKRINKEIADGTFDAYKLREKVKAARLTAAAKRLGDKSGAASSTPLEKGNPVIETPPPASAGSVGGTGDPPKPVVKHYKGPVNSIAPHFITISNGPIAGLVFTLGEGPNSKERIVLGQAPGVDKPMRKLTASEADACRAAGLTLGPDALEGSTASSLSFLQQPGPTQAAPPTGGAATGLSFLQQPGPSPASTPAAPAAGLSFLNQIGTMPAFPSASPAASIAATPGGSVVTDVPPTDEVFF